MQAQAEGTGKESGCRIRRFKGAKSVSGCKVGKKRSKATKDATYYPKYLPRSVPKSSPYLTHKQYSAEAPGARKAAVRRDEGEEDVYQSSEQYQEGDEEVENKGAKELEGDCDRSEEEEADMSGDLVAFLKAMAERDEVRQAEQVRREEERIAAEEKRT